MRNKFCEFRFTKVLIVCFLFIYIVNPFYGHSEKKEHRGIISEELLQSMKSYSLSNMTSKMITEHMRRITSYSGTTKTVYTLESILRKVYQRNLSIREARSKQKIYDEERRQVYSEYYPTIEASIGSNMEWTKDVTKPNNNSNVQSYTNAELSVAQNLFNGMGSKNRLESSNAIVIAQEYAFCAKEQEIIFKTIEGYVKLWKHYKILDNYTQMVENFRELLKAAEQRLINGFSNVQEVESVRSSYSEALLKQSAAQSEIDCTIAELENYMNSKFVGVPVLPNIDLKQLPQTIEDVLKKITTNNPSVLSAYNELQSAEYNLNSAYSQFSPTVDLTGAISRNITHKTRSYEGKKQNDYLLRISMKMPILSNKHFSYVRGAYIKAEELEYIYSAQVNLLYNEAIKVWNELQATISQIQEGEVAVSAAHVTALGYNEELRAGTKSFTDVLYSENKLLEVKNSMVDAIKCYVVAKYKLFLLLGDLTSDFFSIDKPRYELMELQEVIKIS